MASSQTLRTIEVTHGDDYSVITRQMKDLTYLVTMDRVTPRPDRRGVHRIIGQTVTKRFAAVSSAIVLHGQFVRSCE